jgi:nucleoside-diphosphate-sugar epimerase
VTERRRHANPGCRSQRGDRNPSRPALIDAGHEVIGTSRSAESAKRVRALGAKPIALDLLDARAVRKAVLASEPEALVHQADDLSNVSDLKHFDLTFAQTNRLRTEGIDTLLAAAREAGVRRFVAQSYGSPATCPSAGGSSPRHVRGLGGLPERFRRRAG